MIFFTSIVILICVHDKIEVLLHTTLLNLYKWYSFKKDKKIKERAGAIKMGMSM